MSQSNNSVELTLVVKGADAGASDAFNKLGKKIHETYAQGILDAQKFSNAHQQAIEQIAKETFSVPRFRPQEYVPPPKITIEPHPSQAAQAAAQAAQAGPTPQQIAKLMAERAGDDQGPLAQLKSTFGRGSLLAQIVRGTFVMGLDRAAAEMGRIAEGAGKAADNFRLAKTDATGLGIELAKLVPIVGGIVSALQGIREFITLEGSNITAITAGAERGNQFANTGRSLANRRRDINFDAAVAERTAGQEQARLHLEGPSKQIAEVRDRMKNRQEDEAAEIQKRKTELESFQAEQTKLGATKAELSAQMQSLGKEFATKLAISPKLAAPVIDRIRITKGQLSEAEQQSTILAKQIHGAEGDIKGGITGRNKAQQAADTAELKKLQDDYNRERAEKARQWDQRIASQTAQNHAAELAAAGQFYDGQLVLQKDATAKQTADLAQSLKERLRVTAQDSTQSFGARFAQAGQDAMRTAKEIAEVQIRGSQEAAKIEREKVISGLENEQTIRRQIIADLDESVKLQNKGAQYAQEQLQITEKYAARRTEILKLLQSETTDPATRAKLQQELGKLPGLEAGARAGLSATSVKDSARAVLEGAAGTGISAAERALKQSDIEDKYRDLRDKLKATGGPDAQKVLGSLPDLEKRELGFAARQGIEPVGTASVHENKFGRMHGFALAAREGAASQQHNVGPELLKTLQEMLGVLKHQSEIIHQNTGQQAPLF